MSMYKWIRSFLLILVLMITFSNEKGNALTNVDMIVENLMTKIDCNCGCGLNLKNCQRDDPTCTTRPEIIEQIKRLIQEGKKEEEIIKSLVTPAGKAINQARKEGKYLFLFFYEEGSDDCEKMSKVIKKAKKRWAKKAKFFNININGKREKEIIAKYGAYQAPLIVVIAPNGVVTRGFPGVVGLKELEEAFVSPKMTEILKALQNRKVIFLCVQNEDTKYAKEVLKTVNEVAEVLGDSVKVVKVDPLDSQEEELLKQIKVEPKVETTITMVISQSGTVGEKFTGKVSNLDLFKAFQKVVAQRSGCGGSGSGPGGSTCE